MLLKLSYRLAHTRHFMNQLNEADTGNISTAEDRGTTGGKAPPPSSSRNIDPANIQIVNEYNFIQPCECYTSHCSQVEAD